jgi:uncharacterized protein (UPF0264 family)
MTGFLASVATAAEAAVARDGGADIVDLKDPSQGALGALPSPVIAEAVAAIAGRRTLSATAGDLVMEPDAVLPAVRRLAGLGVDIVKVGIFPGGDLAACLRALRSETERGTRIVAVMFADRAPDFDLIPRLRDAGFAGAMLDTAGKDGGGLRTRLSEARLRAFVDAVAARGLMSGLAGSLRLDDIAPLTALRPDYLGFRGALCEGGRGSALTPARLRVVRQAIDAADAYGPAASTAKAAAGAQRAAHSTARASPDSRAAKST